MTISDRNAQRLLDQIVAAHIASARRDGTLVDWTPPSEPNQLRTRRYTAVFADDDQQRDTAPIIDTMLFPDDAVSRDDLIGYARAKQHESVQTRDRTLAFLFEGNLTGMIPVTLDDALRTVRPLDPQHDADYLKFGDQNRTIPYTVISARLDALEWRLQHHQLSADLEAAEILGRLYRLAADEYKPIALIEGRHAAIVNYWHLLDATSPNVVHFSRSLYVSSVSGDSRRITTAVANDDPEYLH